MTDKTCAERITPYMQSRAESIAELFAIADSDEPGEIDGYETDPEQAQERLDECRYQSRLSVASRFYLARVALPTGSWPSWMMTATFGP